MTDPARLSFDIATLHGAYAAGLSPEEVIAEAYARIEAAGDRGIFLHLRPLAEVLAEAGALPPFDAEAMPLWGLPFAVKDNIDLAGCPTTAACPAYAYEPERDAFAVAALKAAGAIPLGKTNLDQFATGLVGVRSPHPPPKNAVDPAIVPGGSSSGSAVAVARGLVSFSLGTDTAGSGRVPAALNNIVGLKPTLGAISAMGVVPACRTLDTISVFALTVPDAWAVFRAAARFDPDDAHARPIAVPAPSAPPPVLRLGVPDAATREFFDDGAQAASFDAALARLAAGGAQIVELDFTPFYEVARMLYEGAWVAERLSVIEDLLESDPGAIHPVTRQIIGAGARLSAVDAFRGIYRLAELKRRAEPLLAGVDLLCVPTMPTFYSVADLEADPVGPNARLGTYTNFVNLMDMCGIAVPVAPRSDGRPGSVTLLGRRGEDALAAALAERLHRETAPVLGATGHPLPATPVAAPGPGPGEIAIAVVGAHMSGLPLNHQLTSRGGRFLHTARTAPAYSLHALPGGPPFRPGLLRTRGGASIALEVWAMPVARFGELVSVVPAPLAIGTVELEDGTSVKGFLVEASGIEGAEDITAHGGWRAYLEAAEAVAG
ncbi:allophanate hydrolase [Histidinibacterium lentulum]|uniref:Allophanate hydrolase n=1 Tax=Histidinibacterium lentulum TaxID=2480588 RepID=A0A3N2QW72_9RHOB|nr:allophanate hydrolase [Histidinibacterium lentulum]ROT99436.1 allophanate hydrolase [Histidinibacterium lentulum]